MSDRQVIIPRFHDNTDSANSDNDLIRSYKVFRKIQAPGHSLFLCLNFYIGHLGLTLDIKKVSP